MLFKNWLEGASDDGAYEKKKRSVIKRIHPDHMMDVESVSTGIFCKNSGLVFLDKAYVRHSELNITIHDYYLNNFTDGKKMFYNEEYIQFRFGTIPSDFNLPYNRSKGLFDPYRSLFPLKIFSTWADVEEKRLKKLFDCLLGYKNIIGSGGADLPITKDYWVVMAAHYDNLPKTISEIFGESIAYKQEPQKSKGIDIVYVKGKRFTRNEIMSWYGKLHYLPYDSPERKEIMNNLNLLKDSDIAKEPDFIGLFSMVSDEYDDLNSKLKSKISPVPSWDRRIGESFENKTLNFSKKMFH